MAIALLVTACKGDAKKKAEDATPSSTPSTTPQGNWYVNAAIGSDTNSGTSAAPFKTITRALGVATTGQVVQVAPGTYSSALGEVFPLAVPAGVTLRGDETSKGAGATPTTINGTALIPGEVNPFEAALTAGAGATVAGLRFLGATPAGGDFGFLAYLHNSGVTLRNSTFTGAQKTAIYVDASSNHVISGNDVNGNSNGAGLAFVTSGSGSKIENNLFFNNAYGVEFDVLGGDLGGGATGSVGGNQMYCNAFNDFFADVSSATIYAANNVWDHNPPSGNDIYNGLGATIVTTGATVASGFCPTPAVNWFVDATNGSDSNNGSSGAPFKTITHALGVATTGEIVNVAPGTYDAALGEVFPLAVPSGVTLHGDETLKGGGTTPYIIEATGFPISGLDAALTAGTGATIAGLKFVGANPGNSSSGVLVYLAIDGVTLRNNTLTGANVSAIEVDGSSNHVIAGNIANNNVRGLVFVNSGTGSKVENNVFTANAFGVEFDFLGGDLGGGPTGSVGGNQIYCNTNTDVWTALGAGTIYAANNIWDHDPPSGNDIFNNSSIPFITTGSTVASGNCP